MKRRILLVDDELAILLTLRAILEMNNFEVDTAASTGEAEQKLGKHTYEMVITDMRMETETSGYEVIKAAKQQAYDPATAILTAYPSMGEDWRSKGAQSLLVKPVNTKELLQQIDHLLQAHSEHKQKHNGKGTSKKITPPPAHAEQSRAAAKKAI